MPPHCAVTRACSFILRATHCSVIWSSRTSPLSLRCLSACFSHNRAVIEDETQIEQWQKQRDHNAAAAVTSRARQHSSVVAIGHQQPPPLPPRPSQQQQQQVVTIPQAASADGSPTASLATVSVSIPIAEPLPPTTLTRARHCRNVFIGSGSELVAASASSFFSLARLCPSLSRTHWANPLAFPLRLLLFPFALIASAFSTGSWLHYLLPTQVRHDDWARQCGYRFPAPGCEALIDVIDPNDPRQDMSLGPKQMHQQQTAYGIELQRAVQQGNHNHPAAAAAGTTSTASGQHARQLLGRYADGSGGDEEDGFVSLAAEDRRTV